MPADRAALLLGMFRACREESATTGPELENLLGRPAAPVRALLEEIVGGR